MTTHIISCSNPEAVQAALLEGRFKEVLHCLQNCFRSFWEGRIARQASPETAEDVFWYAADALERKSQRERITLTASLCTYFNTFIEYYWRKDRAKKSKSPDMKPLDDSLEFYADPHENALIGIYQREKTEAMQRCIAQLSQEKQAIVRAFLEGTKDEDTMLEIGYTDRKGVSVKRKRTFEKLGKLLEAAGFRQAFP